MKLGRKIVEKVDEQESHVDGALEKLKASDSSARLIAAAIVIVLAVVVVLWLM